MNTQIIKNNQKELILLQDLGRIEYGNQGHKTRFGLYKCFCGNEFKTRIADIKNGKTKSCGCYNKQRIKESNTKHNLSSNKLYSVWYDMMNRCYNKECSEFARYGNIGVYVCQEWHNIENFINDMSSTFKKGLTLDKDTICIKKGISPAVYSKDTCLWTTKKIQARATKKLRINNTSGYRGVSWNKKNKKFQVHITINSKKINLGLFNSALDGAKIYDKYVIDNNLEHTLNFV